MGGAEVEKGEDSDACGRGGGEAGEGVGLDKEGDVVEPVEGERAAFLPGDPHVLEGVVEHKPGLGVGAALSRHRELEQSSRLDVPYLVVADLEGDVRGALVERVGAEGTV